MTFFLVLTLVVAHFVIGWALSLTFLYFAPNSVMWAQAYGDPERIWLRLLVAAWELVLPVTVLLWVGKHTIQWIGGSWDRVEAIGRKRQLAKLLKVIIP